MTMTKTIIFCTVAIALTGSAVTLAQAQQQEPQMNPDLASFFVAENPNGIGNLGGLAEATRITVWNRNAPEPPPAGKAPPQRPELQGLIPLKLL